MTPEEIARTMPEWPKSGIYFIPVDLYANHDYNDIVIIKSIQDQTDAAIMLFISELGAALDFVYKRESDLVGMVMRNLNSQNKSTEFHDDDKFDNDGYVEIVDDANDHDYESVTKDQMIKLLDMVGIHANIDQLLRPTREKR